MKAVVIFEEFLSARNNFVLKKFLRIIMPNMELFVQPCCGKNQYFFLVRFPSEGIGTSNISTIMAFWVVCNNHQCLYYYSCWPLFTSWISSFLLLSEKHQVGSRRCPLLGSGGHLPNSQPWKVLSSRQIREKFRQSRHCC